MPAPAPRASTTPARWRAATARALGIDAGEVVVCSTGVIGKPLPMDAVAQGIARAAGELSESGGAAAADAIRTTDAWAKTSTATVALERRRRTHRRDGQGRGHDPARRGDHHRDRDDRRGRRAGRAGGLLRGAADASLNLVSVDGSESTNDTLVVLASGASGVTASGADAAALGRALTSALLDVARQMVADGEGASRFAHYIVTGAADDDEARTAVRAIGEDILVRCALHGSDPNWGRMLARAGTCGVALDPERIAVWVGPTQLVAEGVEVAARAPRRGAALGERRGRDPHRPGGGRRARRAVRVLALARVRDVQRGVHDVSRRRWSSWAATRRSIASRSSRAWRAMRASASCTAAARRSARWRASAASSRTSSAAGA